MTTLCGLIKSLIADPSARNSGLLIMLNLLSMLLSSKFNSASRMLRISLAVPRGTVDFSTITLCEPPYSHDFAIDLTTE